MRNKRDIAIVGFVVVAFLAVFIFQNVELSGQASRNVQTKLQLGINEYIFKSGERKIIEGIPITLVKVAGSKEVIMDVNGKRKSVNEYTTRVINNVQIESVSVAEDSAFLRITFLEKLLTTCVDSDVGDVFLKGKCDDRFYPNGVEDFCDFDELKEYNCGYDKYIDEVHCLKHVVKCTDGCKSGACISK